jgi:hypothetical protein
VPFIIPASIAVALARTTTDGNDSESFDDDEGKNP